MSFEPGDKAFRIADGHEVEIVSGPHRAYQVRQPDGTETVVKAVDLSATSPDPRREAIREGLRAFTDTYTLCTGDGREYPVNQEELVSTIRAALDELPADAAYQYLDRDGDLWSGTPGGYYKYVERQNGFPGEWGLVLDYAELQRYYGPLTPVTE